MDIEYDPNTPSRTLNTLPSISRLEKLDLDTLSLIHNEYQRDSYDSQDLLEMVFRSSPNLKRLCLQGVSATRYVESPASEVDCTRMNRAQELVLLKASLVPKLLIAFDKLFSFTSLTRLVLWLCDDPIQDENGILGLAKSFRAHEPLRIKHLAIDIPYSYNWNHGPNPKLVRAVHGTFADIVRACPDLKSLHRGWDMAQQNMTNPENAAPYPPLLKKSLEVLSLHDHGYGDFEAVKTVRRFPDWVTTCANLHQLGVQLGVNWIENNDWGGDSEWDKSRTIVSKEERDHKMSYFVQVSNNVSST
jgi:hypothetical protein